MLKNVKNKFSNLRKKDSIVHKLDNIKKIDKQSSSSQYGPDGQPISSDLTFNTGKLEEMQAETVNKIDEMLNAKAESINANAESIRTMENRLSKMDISISTVKRNIDEYGERFNKMEENILELLSLYEVVSNTVNPFVGDNENKPIYLDKFDAIEKRMKNLENNLADFSNLNSIDSNVSEEVLEHIRNEIEEKLTEFNKKLDKLESETQAEKMVIDSTQETLDSKPIVITETQTPVKSGNSPLLQHLDNNPETFIILLNWVEFLMEKVGRNNLMDVLDYYSEIGWISDNVSNKILAYAGGIDYYDEKPTWKLMPQDHTKSLMFIERIHGKKMDMGTLHKIERDVDKVKHHTEPYFKV